MHTILSIVQDKALNLYSQEGCWCRVYKETRQAGFSTWSSANRGEGGELHSGQQNVAWAASCVAIGWQGRMDSLTKGSGHFVDGGGPGRPPL